MPEVLPTTIPQQQQQQQLQEQGDENQNATTTRTTSTSTQKDTLSNARSNLQQDSILSLSLESSSSPSSVLFYKCSSCLKNLPRHHFQKKEFQKLQHYQQQQQPQQQPQPQQESCNICCHYCKRKATAERCGQPIPTEPMERLIFTNNHHDSNSFISSTKTFPLKEDAVDFEKKDNPNNRITGSSTSTTSTQTNTTTTNTTTEPFMLLLPTGGSARISGSGMKRRPNNYGYCNYLDQLFSKDCFLEIVQLQVFTTAKDISESMAAIHAAVRHGNIGKTSSSITTKLQQQQEESQDLSNDGTNTDNANANNDNNKKNILCLCIGDGSTPRTAVLAAFLQPEWTCVSIDPQLSSKWQGNHPTVQRLIGFVGTLESYLEIEQQQQQKPQQQQQHKVHWDHLVLLCVHSHVQFRDKQTKNHSTDTRLETIRSMYGNPPTTLVSIPCCPTYRHVSDIGRTPDVQYDDDCIFSACRTVYVWNETSINGEFLNNDGIKTAKSTITTSMTNNHTPPNSITNFGSDPKSSDTVICTVISS